MTEVPETGLYEFSFRGFERSIQADLFDSKDMTVYEACFPIVSPDEDLVTGTDFNRAWERDGKLPGIFPNINRVAVTFQPKLAGLNTLDFEALPPPDGAEPLVQGNHHARPVIFGGTFLLNGPVKLILDGNHNSVPKQFSFFETIANGLRKPVVFFPCRGDCDTPI